MKKIISIICFLLVVGFVFATEWTTLNPVDEFGDPTDSVQIYTWIPNVKYGDYSWEYEDCAIIIAKGNAYCPYVPSFYIGSSGYSKWIIKIKIDDSTIHEYTGELYGGSYVYPDGFTYATSIISDLKEGCKIVIYPDNRYSTDKYNLGSINLTITDLAKLK